MRLLFLSGCLIGGLLTACRKSVPSKDPVTYGSGFALSISSDKAVYKPGETARFTVNKQLEGNWKIRLRHLNEQLQEWPLTGKEFSIPFPQKDFTGYLVELLKVSEGKDSIAACIGVDVSSNWSRFPRYGFLSSFGTMKSADQEKIIQHLNRHHINGLQFYDWQYKHHKPLAGTGTLPFSSWTDIANREVSLATLQTYIRLAHEKGMNAMFYNLAFGALKDAAADGVSESWYLFKDANRTAKDFHSLPSPYFKSDIFLTDAANPAWQQYLLAQHHAVYQALDFDGFHADALGNRGRLYNYAGQEVNQAEDFGSFLMAVKQADPSKKLVMNAVNQYGQKESIAGSGVDFLYTEVWSPNDTYADLANILRNNEMLGGGKASVLAAYINYARSDNPGYFNAPGVLLADAVMFSMGGAHLELGEHLLSKEYFPHNTLGVSDDLQKAMLSYYDFLVAYENLLRDGGSWNQLDLSCTNQVLSVQQWPPVSRKVAALFKKLDNRQVIHLINFSAATDLSWRDTNGTQPKPPTLENASMSCKVQQTVNKVWMASPDWKGGAPEELTFVQQGNDLVFSMPRLQYWNMIVIE